MNTALSAFYNTLLHNGLGADIRLDTGKDFDTINCNVLEYRQNSASSVPRKTH